MKPENFLLFKNDLNFTDEDLDYSNNSFDSFDANQFIKITDFGLAHAIYLGSTKTLMKFKSGTYYYIAPEITNVSSKISFISLYD